jgi:hypothetical protein
MELLIFLSATFSNYPGLMKMCIFALSRTWSPFGSLPGMMKCVCPLNEWRAERSTLVYRKKRFPEHNRQSKCMS